MNVNLELYRVFYYVAKHLSFSVASQVLYLSQSAVSQSIKQLETKLNTPLFNRSTKQVTLTPQGIKLMEYIEPALNLIAGGEAYLKETMTLDRGQLHIGASDTICKYYLLDYFKKFHHLYPGVEIRVTNRTSLQCVALLKKGLVDLIVTNLPNPSISDDMQVMPVLDFQDVFIASNKYNIASESHTLQSLSKHPILMLAKQTTTSNYLYQLFESEGLSIKPSVELGSIDLLIDLTGIDLGISFVPDFCMKNRPNFRILKTCKPIPRRQLGVVIPEKRPLSEASKKFIALLSKF
ncbi:LysR family transcriptional regulator [Petrocella sp. FN5]|uniref:LysR family transcriptional regulator n=1 Tax=Petrocella sp. FN5 TaxID=3032002 RepID=UPI0023DB2746|nr:LysR family transcriptional regulator [Petrocella sp. FN5]MDF1617806.1 LysR family transcriptional regulator [Petrocella sp. FN5]